MSDFESDYEVHKEKDKGGKNSAEDGSLVSLIFSWSLEDVFNKNLFKDKVSFLHIYPLLLHFFFLFFCILFFLIIALAWHF